MFPPQRRKAKKNEITLTSKTNAYSCWGVRTRRVGLHCPAIAMVQNELLFIYGRCVRAPMHASFPFFEYLAWHMAIQGPLSYMADVYSFGRHSRWKIADALWAVVGFAMVASVPVLVAFGVMRFPWHVTCVWVACTVWAARTKLAAAALLHTGKAAPFKPTTTSGADARAWMVQHATWHGIPLVLTVYVVVAVTREHGHGGGALPAGT